MTHSRCYIVSTGVTVSEMNVVTIFEDLALHEDGTETRYGLDGPGIESRWRRDFPYTSRPLLGITQPSVQYALGSIPGKEEGHGVDHPFPNYCPGQRKSSSIPLLPCRVFMNSSRVSFSLQQHEHRFEDLKSYMALNSAVHVALYALTSFCHGHSHVH